MQSSVKIGHELCDDRDGIPSMGLKLLTSVFVGRLLKPSFCLFIYEKGTIVIFIPVRIIEGNV